MIRLREPVQSRRCRRSRAAARPPVVLACRSRPRACPAASGRRACPRRSRRPARPSSARRSRARRARTARPARAPRRERPTGRRTGRRRRRSSGRRAGPSGVAAPARPGAARAARIICSSAPFCGPKTFGASSNVVRTSVSTTIFALPIPPASSIACERTRAAVGRRRAADRHQDHLRAGLRGGGDQLAGPVRGRRPRVALIFRDQPEPGRHRHLDDRGPAVLHQPETGPHRRPERPLHRDRDQLPTELRQQRIQRAFTPVGDGTQIGRHQSGLLQPPPDRARHLGGIERALERVRARRARDAQRLASTKPKGVRPL